MDCASQKTTLRKKLDFLKKHKSCLLNALDNLDKMDCASQKTTLRKKLDFLKKHKSCLLNALDNLDKGKELCSQTLSLFLLLFPRHLTSDKHIYGPSKARYRLEVLRSGNEWLNSKAEAQTLAFRSLDEMVNEVLLQLAHLPSEIKVGLGVEKEALSHMTPQEVPRIPFSSEEQWRPEECLGAASEGHLQDKQTDNSKISPMNKQRRKRNKTQYSLNNKVSDLERKVQDLISTQTERENNFREVLKKIKVDASKEGSGNFLRLDCEIEDMKEQFKELEAQINDLRRDQHKGRNIGAGKMKAGDTDRELWSGSNSKASEDLVRQGADNATSFIDIVTQRTTDRLQQLEAKVDELRESIHETLDGFGEKCEGMEVKLQMVCSAFDRQQPISGAPKQTSDVIEGNAKKLSELEDKMASLLGTISSADYGHGNRWTGFAAKITGRWLNKKMKMSPVEKGKIVADFTDIVNCGGHFNSSDGEFTAPSDGVYVTYLSIQQYYEGQINLCVVKKSSVDSRKSVITDLCTDGHLSGDCHLSFVEMASGDTLYVKAVSVDDQPFLTDRTVFSCFLVL